MYYVTTTGYKNMLAVIDMKTGARVSIITLRGGEVDGNPIITGDRCSVIVKDGNVRRGLIYKIPKGTFITDFRIT